MEPLEKALAATSGLEVLMVSTTWMEPGVLVLVGAVVLVGACSAAGAGQRER